MLFLHNNNGIITSCVYSINGSKLQLYKLSAFMGVAVLWHGVIPEPFEFIVLHEIIL